MNSTISQFAISVSHDLLEQANNVLFSLGHSINLFGIEEVCHPYGKNKAYMTVAAFDFVDEIINIFVYLSSFMVDVLIKLYSQVTDSMTEGGNYGIPSRNLQFIIGDNEFFQFELIKKINSSLNFINAFDRRHIINTLAKIPGGLNVPEPVLLSLQSSSDGLNRFYENLGIYFNDHNEEGLGMDSNPLKTSQVWTDLQMIIDDDEPHSLQAQGFNFHDNATLWYNEQEFYKFYKSKLWKWFEQSNSKTENLNNLGLSNIDKMIVLDNLWMKAEFGINSLGFGSVSSPDINESLGSRSSTIDGGVRQLYNSQYGIVRFGSTMKQRTFDALDAPRATIIPFISHEALAHIGIFKNFAECAKPIYINNEFYMEGFEKKIPAHYDIILLPDFVSRFLQLRFNLVDTDKITQFQYIIAFSLRFYMVLISFRYLLFWLIGLNPYQNFFSSVIATSVDWIETVFGAYLPCLYGIPLSIPMFLIFANWLLAFIYRLTFTFPYLPSEASIQYIYGNGLMNFYPRLRETVDRWDLSAMDKFIRWESLSNYKDPPFRNECFPFFRFEGLPKLWVENGIPDQIRFSWFWKHPLIFKKYYQDFEVFRIESNIQFLPNIVLKDLNSNLHNLNLHDLQKMNTKELYSFLLENLSQNLRTDLVNLLFVESNAKHIDVSDFLDPARLEIYSEILKKLFDIN